MNNKGFILGEFTLKTVISIISLLILIFLLFNLYSTFSGKSALDHAKASAERVAEKVNAVANSGEEEHFLLTEPKGWYLDFFEGVPLKSCPGGANCLCVCKNPGFNGCDTQGICASILHKISLAPPIQIDLTDILIKPENGQITVKKVEGKA